MRAPHRLTSLWIVLFTLGLVFGLGVAIVRAQADIQAQWARSKHANRLLATLESSADGFRGPAAAHCGRCHAQQGFLAWLPQLQRGNPGLITKPDGAPADVPFLLGLGLSRRTVQPITCTTCHQDDFRLRQAGSTPLLPAGFRAIGVGLGAQCMLCHNSRNGAIVWNQEDPRRYTAPHTSSQADVLLGKNVFFLDYGNNFISPHASFIGDSCVTCHVRFSQASHTFKADATSCARCHGRDLTMERVQGPARTMLRELEATIIAKIMANRSRIQVVRVWSARAYAYVDTVTIDPATIQRVDLVEIAGQQGITLTLTGGRRIQTQLGELRDAQGRPSFATSDPIVRAGWNYWLLRGDDSFGVHNPRFFRQVILTTLEALR